jgi:hypothetical protein
MGDDVDVETTVAPVAGNNALGLFVYSVNHHRPRAASIQKKSRKFKLLHDHTHE